MIREVIKIYRTYCERESAPFIHRFKRLRSFKIYCKLISDPEILLINIPSCSLSLDYHSHVCPMQFHLLRKDLRTCFVKNKNFRFTPQDLKSLKGVPLHVNFKIMCDMIFFTECLRIIIMNFLTLTHIFFIGQGTSLSSRPSPLRDRSGRSRKSRESQGQSRLAFF